MRAAGLSSRCRRGVTEWMAVIRITLDTYSHKMLDMQELAAEFVASVITAADAELEGQA